MLYDFSFFIFVIIALVVNCLVLYLVISSATKSSKQVYNQEMTVFYLKKILQVLENKQQNSSVAPEADALVTDLNNPETMKKLLSVLPNKTNE